MTKLIAGSLLLAALLLAVACGDDDTTTNGGDGTTAATTAAADVCDQKDALEAAVDDLANLDVLAEGTNALDASVENVKTELDDLKTAVGDEVADEVEAMETAVEDAEDTLSGISDDATLNEKIDDVQSAVTGVATAADSLITALETDC
jgi:predicted  nucleic acid-binding Zn-ribbon protein